MNFHKLINARKSELVEIVRFSLTYILTYFFMNEHISCTNCKCVPSCDIYILTYFFTNEHISCTNCIFLCVFVQIASVLLAVFILQMFSWCNNFVFEDN